MNTQNVFHAYDVRGIVPDELNASLVYKIAHAYFSLVDGQRYIIGYDMRETSADLFTAFVRAAHDLGKEIESVGMVTTDMLYFALGRYEYDGGIMITASHNPKIYNGIKMMARGVVPVSMQELKERFDSVSVEVPHDLLERKADIPVKQSSSDYVDHVLGCVDINAIPPLKVVVDAGNGMGGLNARKVLERLPSVEVIEMYFEPNANFPHHEANPVIRSNTKELGQMVVAERADLGIAYDGDGDRCLFVDSKGEYVPGHLMVALFARYYMQKEQGARIAYEHRNVYAIQHEIREMGGEGVPVRAGHSFFKERMHNDGIIFGGESSAHYYFRDTYFADNGVLPFLILFEMLGNYQTTLRELLSYYRENFFASGELNFMLNEGTDPAHVKDAFHAELHPVRDEEPDGLVMEFDNWRFNARMSNTEPVMRINIEALASDQLDESILTIHEIMSSFGTFLGDGSARSADELKITAKDRFEMLLDNLWYTWNPHYILPIVDLYGDGWRKNSPPGEFSSQYGIKKLSQVLDDKSWEIEQNVRLFEAYMDESLPTWFSRFISEDQNGVFRILKEKPVAYFSLEYGLVDWLQIYSGGLGVLAGDFIKEASDMGIPFAAVGIFYHQGYFHQDFDGNGLQQETYIEQRPEEYPLELVTDDEGKPLTGEIEIIDHPVYFRAWKLHVGKTPLYLLDTNFEKNERQEDRMITAHLYGGDQDTRIRQEILLGIGGPRLLERLGIKPALYHMNEGHSGFLVLEIARQFIEGEGKSFDEAIAMVDERLVFTNHTLKQAGNDIFSYELMERYFGTYLDNLHTDMGRVFELGKDDLYAHGDFSMTVLGLRNAKISNAVSLLHGEAAKRLWPDFGLVPVTNGVHMPTWVSPEIHALLDKYVGEDWHFPGRTVDYEKVQQIPDDELWETHLERKNKLITTLNNELALELDPEALTIAWSRRLTSYKRPDMIVSDLERLKQLVQTAGKPVQILIAGKAHPRDGIGKDLLQKMNQSVSQPEFRNRVVVVPGYNWQLARRMVSGADVWLNTPYRFEEASGTSGMKAAANGVLQLTTKDGWTDEVDWFQKGWLISEENPVDSLHDTLEYKIIPLYFDHNGSGYNEDWLQMMKNTMQTVLEHYSTVRMMKQYLDLIYKPVLDGL
ncbi:MAG: Phosphomannomutase/phosphoglucomutase [candidate division WS6 bacterium OLB20]|uniref:Phosphomannomutase/phosphoglucomutase n=1 Tax=candidate division WS6 bacterium OLB20 TaxID=1617426 RepID=A0A136M011_9BACT|nr:MAG: Phosphomannomutase/phosphoglucomutase [candidate division WS6 bacterium OLB20]